MRERERERASEREGESLLDECFVFLEKPALIFMYDKVPLPISCHFVSAISDNVH